MDKRTCYKNKEVFLYILVLFQTCVIVFTATYVVLSVNSTRNNESAFLKNGYRQFYDLKRASRGRTRDVKGLNAFNIVVRAKGRIDIDSNEVRDSDAIDQTFSTRKRTNESDVELDNFNRNNNQNNYGNNEEDNNKINKNKKFSNNKKNINKTNNNDYNENSKYERKNEKSMKKTIGNNSEITRNINGKKHKGNNHNSDDDTFKRKKRKNINTISRNVSNTNSNISSKKQKGNIKSLAKLSPPKQREPILMFIAIMSAPERIHRRNALRRSWLRQCEQHNTSCHIFTDALDMHGKRLPEEIYVALEQEQFLHKDLIMTESPGGINFARRYLWIINWANRNYKFDFLLRVDDDYFICMDRLFLELPNRRNISKLYWGHVHCYPPGGIRVDEGFVIVSNDLVQHFIKEEYSSLMCHPFGDQAMAMWINDIENVTYFGDPRVKNEVTAGGFILEHYPDICENFLALHGSYPVQIEQYWHRTLTTPWKRHPVTEITYPCGDQDKTYNKTNFKGMYYADPIPCKDSPVWQIGDIYVGRSGKRNF